MSDDHDLIQRARDAAPADNTSTPLVIYILYLVGLAIGLTSVIGVIIAYLSKDHAPDWLKTHYDFQIRTFWTWLVYLVVGIVLSPVIIGAFVLLFSVVWLIIRCVKGLSALSRNQPIDNVHTLLW